MYIYNKLRWFCKFVWYNEYLQFDEHKDQVLVEQILQVVFLDTEHPSSVSRTNYHFLAFTQYGSALMIYWWFDTL